ncbi:hypothetical protein D9C73_024099 [Collichthys lucidus]|uniref:Uncharacterized protein n=1 Tax=Collichthys lucidus TaxID=240159 RepID=A0A4U5VNP3_COLLU|nr:hypothetical protein D9C73_024099 [Collichthys lucidus]
MFSLALLPPVNRVRPRIPPPPPPTNPAEAKSPKSPESLPKIIEQLEKSNEVKKVMTSTFYENLEFHNKTEAASSRSSQTTPPRKTALLPPHMKPAANSQPVSSLNTTSQTFVYDLPKSEPDLNMQPWDPNYSYTEPEGTGLPAPPLPPRPSFMKSMPDYVLVLPSSHSSPSSQKSPSDQSHVPSPISKGSADRGLLPGNPNVVLVSLGKLLSEERVETIKGEPSSCSQCGSVLDSFYDNEVTMHGYGNFTSHFLSGAELTDSDYLKEAAARFPSPPPLSQTKDYLQRHILGLSESGATALGPAALLAIATASRQPGSKVDGKANTELGNLEVEDNDARTLLSSTIFYQELGEYAANQGLREQTAGWMSWEDLLIALEGQRMRGEREAGHKGIREMGNVDQNTEITFQFGANEQDAEGERKLVCHHWLANNQLIA